MGNKPELQHLHLRAIGTDVAIYFCVLPRLCPLESYKYAEFLLLLYTQFAVDGLNYIYIYC